MQIEILANYGDLSLRAAEIIAELVRQRPGTVLGLPTGSTPEGCYAALRHSGVSFAQVQTFNLDEYLGLGPEHPQSYHAFMREQLFAHIDLPADQTHLPNGLAPDPVTECQRYEAAIRTAGGLDLVMLGLGQNGHIGFNEPGTPFASRTRPVRLAANTRNANARFFGSPNAVPAKALTMGIGTILEAREILLLAAGEAKADAVRRLLTDPPSPDLPASALLEHPRVRVLLDHAAAELIPGRLQFTVP